MDDVNRVFDLRDGDTKTIRNLLADRKVSVEGDTEELWVHPDGFRQRVRCVVVTTHLDDDLKSLPLDLT